MFILRSRGTAGLTLWDFGEIPTCPNPQSLRDSPFPRGVTLLAPPSPGGLSQGWALLLSGNAGQNFAGGSVILRSRGSAGRSPGSVSDYGSGTALLTAGRPVHYPGRDMDAGQVHRNPVYVLLPALEYGPFRNRVIESPATGQVEADALAALPAAMEEDCVPKVPAAATFMDSTPLVSKICSWPAISTLSWLHAANSAMNAG